MANFRSTTVTNTSTNVSLLGVAVKRLNIVNQHSAAIFVKFYNQTIATFQDTPAYTQQVAATSSVTVLGNPVFDCPTAMCVRVVTNSADNGNTAAATLPIIEIQY